MTLALAVAAVTELREPSVQPTQQRGTHQSPPEHQETCHQGVVPIDLLVDGALVQGVLLAGRRIIRADLQEVIQQRPSPIGPPVDQHPADLVPGIGPPPQEEAQVDHDHVPSMAGRTHIGRRQVWR
eukprot:CAMPEP_0181462792 /NCGR_PEP_ID=MMETSP1110-20121109/34580_1 /TAXON_ID=174948 /ORGANISM="Symbiodinium sp., Strain CCMP421" /LENGTH=125 /DNA_ID=CAMNT_0023587467 /DNA_START=247 /DNA_END=623 /DNA_ORIENTATION=+